MSSAVQNFIRQQGFADEPPDACNMHFEGLYFQPRIVFAAVLLAVLFQSAWLFLAIGGILWWNVFVPASNPFERAYNHFLAAPRGRPPLTPAPGPRRFAQAVNAAFNTASGACLLLGFEVASWVLQAGLVLAFSALIFGKFCLGAWMFHILRGEVAFANSTLPWARGRS